ncbi:MAG: hypothetical protein IT566_04625 [Rhodospirillaceae bacterium]|nr:hypothetical protein [Rhodospirillaceae bacterium]
MSTLTDIIAAESAKPVFPAARAFADELRARYGDSTAAVIFYGSCLRAQTDNGLILDFYVVVDRLQAALKNPISAVGARLLPPNVYYHEMPYEDRKLRAKVAVLSVRQFLRGTGSDAFTSALWARFAQPACVLYARSAEIERRMIAALAEAVTTTAVRAAALFTAPFSARDLWVRAFKETYAAELRPESSGKSVELIDRDLPRYEAVTAALFEQDGETGLYPAPGDEKTRERALATWRLRRLAGKTLNAARLIKAAFTFSGGLDYAVAKIERHSGVKIELTEKEKRTPLITGVRLFFKVRRRGGLN